MQLVQEHADYWRDGFTRGNVIASGLGGVPARRLRHRHRGMPKRDARAFTLTDPTIRSSQKLQLRGAPDANGCVGGSTTAKSMGRFRISLPSHQIRSMKNSFSVIVSAILLFSASAAKTQNREPVSSYSMGTGMFELYAKTGCAEGKPDAVDIALAEALHSADLLPDRAVEMRRGVRDAHAALVARGGCRGYPAAELTRIRANQNARETEIQNSGGEMELELPAALGGKISGRASYGTIAVEGTPFTVLCLETPPTQSPATSLALISPNPAMLREGDHDLAQIGAVARLRITGLSANTELQYAMIGISAPEGGNVRGSFTGFLRSGMQMFSGNFTAVRSEDPCGMKRELTSRRQ